MNKNQVITMLLMENYTLKEKMENIRQDASQIYKEAAKDKKLKNIFSTVTNILNEIDVWEDEHEC